MRHRGTSLLATIIGIGWAAEAHAQRIPEFVIGLVLSPVILIVLSIVLAIVTKSWKLGLKSVLVGVISPFLGYDKIINEIADVGGVRHWDPGEYDPENDWQRMLWHWLKQRASGEHPLPRLYLGYGTDDSFATANGLLGDLLPPDHVFTTPGGHTPNTMKKLWRLFLKKDVLK